MIARKKEQDTMPSPADARYLRRVLDDDGYHVAEHLRPDQHGRSTGYTYWGCRCKPCRNWQIRRNNPEVRADEQRYRLAAEAAIRAGKPLPPAPATAVTTPHAPSAKVPALPQAAPANDLASPHSAAASATPDPQGPPADFDAEPHVAIDNAEPQSTTAETPDRLEQALVRQLRLHRITQ